MNEQNTYSHALKRVAHNTAAQLVGKALSMGLAIFTLGIMARYLGAEQFGWYTTVTTYLQMFGIMADLGLTLVTTQMLSEDGVDEKRVLANLFGFRLVTTILFFGTALVMVGFFPYEPIIKTAVALTTIAFAAISFNQIFVGVLQRHMAMWWAVIAENIYRVVMLGALLAVVASHKGFLWVMGVVTIGFISYTVGLYGFSRRFASYGCRFEGTVWKEIIRRSWPITITTVCNMVYLRGDLFVMSFYRSQHEIGLYGASFRVIDVLNTVPFMIMGVMLPLLTNAWSTGKKDLFAKYMQTSFDILTFLSLPIALVGMMVSKKIMILLGGPEFADGAVFLRMIIFAVLGVYVGATFTHAILAINRQQKIMWVFAINAFLAAAGYILFIPAWGGYAGAVITLINEFLVPLMVAFVLYRLIRFKLSLKVFGKLVVCAGVAAACVWPLRDASLFVSLSVGAVTYLGLVFALKAISVDTIQGLLKRPS